MKQSHYLFASILVSSLPLISAPRPVVRAAQQQQQIIYVPVPVAPQKPPMTREEEDNQVLLQNISSIVGNFGGIIIDPYNTPQVLGNVSNMLYGIVNIAQQVMKHRITRNPQDQIEHQKLIKKLNALIIAYARELQIEKRHK